VARFKHEIKYHKYDQVEKQTYGVAEQSRKVNFHFVHVSKSIQVFFRAQNLDCSGGTFQKEIEEYQSNKQE
jgi:hypothetical protein